MDQAASNVGFVFRRYTVRRGLDSDVILVGTLLPQIGGVLLMVGRSPSRRGNAGS